MEVLNSSVNKGVNLIWIEKQDLINSDLKNNQLKVDNHQIPKAIVEGNCSIEAIDNAIKEFYDRLPSIS
ncbi:hypothetical protein N9Y89_01295 [bacterium]|nr:hypothetical protein [bacterium]